ncbi:hypothetical protein [Asaia prunellae]|nr:hypothetical protein [Asaia prunellae]
MANLPRSRSDVPTINVRELIIMHIVLAIFIVGIMLLDWHVN